jgi:hypothetical protein
VTASHDLDPYLQLLKRDGTLCLGGHRSIRIRIIKYRFVIDSATLAIAEKCERSRPPHPRMVCN